jgi:hypothetical protein
VKRANVKALAILLLGVAAGGVIGWLLGIMQIPIEKPDPDFLEKMAEVWNQRGP